MKTIQNYFLSLFLVFFISVAPSAVLAQKDPLDDGVLRILAIGNSFSEDAIENYLYELAKASGKTMVIGNLYIGGAPLSLHVRNVNEDKAAYSYRKITSDGNKTVTPDVRISDALVDEPWDYISFQQASPLSGKYETYKSDLPALFAYVKTHVRYPSTKYILHQTWAYQQDSKHDGFANYDRSQLKMYEAIARTSQQAFKLIPFDLLVPAGTAVQNARTSFIADHYTRDGYHLNLDYGRFTAACTWFETLFQQDVTTNVYKPLKVTDIQAEIAKKAAHEAVLHPFAITPLKAFQIMDISR